MAMGELAPATRCDPLSVFVVGGTGILGQSRLLSLA
jgi:hypothetical protein